MSLSVRARKNNLILRFPDYLQAFGNAPAFNEEQLEAHRRTIELRAGFRSAAEAAADPEFVSSLWRTLELWRMNSRRARLSSEPDLHDSLRKYAREIHRLDNERLDAEDLSVDRIGGEIWGLIDKLNVTRTGSRLVAATKALHHVLPDLIVPMDRQFTGSFFGWNTYVWQRKQKSAFIEAFRVFSEMARCTNPAQYVGTGWNTSITKVIDNAIIAYCQANFLDDSSQRRALVALAKDRGILN